MKLKILTPVSNWESRLSSSHDLLDIEKLITDLNESIKNCKSQNEKISLQYVRQCAYNRKKKIIKENGVLKHDNNSFKRDLQKSSRSVSHVQAQTPQVQKETQRTQNPESFAKDASNIISTLKLHATTVLFASSAVLTSLFIYFQSVPLYESLGFPAPEFCSLGAILMIAGFALANALTRSKIALILCLYASCYEVVLIVNGTIKNELTISADAVNKNPQVQLLQEKVSHNLEAYNIAKAKYNDENSNVYKNSWYKQTALNPAFSQYESSSRELTQTIKSLEVNSKTSSWDKVGMMKILFRLGLVFLCMLSVHEMLKGVKK